jgi:hypothetical protein
MSCSRCHPLISKEFGSSAQVQQCRGWVLLLARVVAALEGLEIGILRLEKVLGLVHHLEAADSLGFRV